MGSGTMLTAWDTTLHKDALRGGLRKIFDSTERAIEITYPDMFNDKSTDLKIERDMRMAGFGLAEQVAEGQDIPIQDIPSPDSKEYTQVKYGTGFRITMEMKMFNQIKLIQKLTASLARSMKLTKDKTVAQLWNSPTATYTGYDGLALGHNSHTCKDDAGSTYDNLGAAAISTTALEGVLYYFKMLKDDQGQIIGATPDIIYFEPTQMFTVDILLGSKGMPFEQSNDKNPYSRFGLKQYPYIRLTSTTAWGVLAKKDPLFDINVFTSLKPDFHTKDAPDNTRDTVVTSNELYAFGHGDPRMVYVGNT